MNSSDSSDIQYTLSNEICLTGRGVHSGEPSELVLKPAPKDYGIRFNKSGQPVEKAFQPLADRVSDTSRGTTVTFNGQSFQTIEHIMAALVGSGVDNCLVEMSANEPPIMDGSALSFVTAIKEIGKTGLPGTEKASLKLDQIVAIEEGNKSIVGWPHEGLRITYCLDYSDTWVGNQRVTVDVDPDVFASLIAPARTFCFEHEINWLKANGLAKGGSYENALVLNQDGIVNGPLRSEQELAYHKILDFIGDLALIGKPIRGHFVACRSGHEMNIKFAKKIMNRNAAQGGEKNVIIEAKEIEQLLPHRFPMLLVDRVIDLEEGKRVVGIKNVTMNEQFFQGHFPGHPIMPGVLIVEAMAQCGGVLLMKSVENAQEKVVYFVTIDNVKFRQPVIPGDQLRFELTVDKIKGRIAKMHGKAYVGDDLACQADLMCTLMDK